MRSSYQKNIVRFYFCLQGGGQSSKAGLIGEVELVSAGQKKTGDVGNK